MLAASWASTLRWINALAVFIEAVMPLMKEIGAKLEGDFDKRLELFPVNRFWFEPFMVRHAGLEPRPFRRFNARASA